MELSIVIPVYNEGKNIEPLYKELKEVLNRVKKSYEVIFVDDGSTDNTFDILKRIHMKDKKIRIIKFYKNIGKSDALSKGFKIAKGKFIITMDGDLQDNPKEIPKFIKHIKNSHYDIIVGWRKKRKDPITKRLPSKIFNKLISLFTGLNIHDSNCCFKIYKKEVAKKIKIYGELHRYIPIIASWYGFEIGEIEVKHRPRIYGKSKWGIERLIKGFLDLITVKFITDYGKRPMHVFGSIGIILFFIGFVIALYLLYIRLVLLMPIGDRPLLFLSVLLIITGIQSVTMGFLGEMITQISVSEKEKKIKTKIF